MASPRLVIASRGSRLALTQTEMVADALKAAHPGVETEVLVVTTTGDRDRRPFSAIGGKGLFTTEVERAVVEVRADIAVHSAKDLTSELAPGCIIACVPRRARSVDVVIGGSGASGEERLGTLAADARVGTSSMRRRALLAEARSDLEAVDFRGNLDTRLRKVADGEVDAAIVAAAGLDRLLGQTETGVLAAPLDPDWWVPPPGQGALAVEALADRGDVADLLAPLEDPSTRSELMAERAFSERLEGGCTVPLGCSARREEGRLVLVGLLALPDGGRTLRDRISGPADEAATLGRELADAIISSGGDEILEELAYEEPPPVEAP
ncbi:MAG: hydroxymethylbilane synthase [Actinomycetota bacterium]